MLAAQLLCLLLATAPAGGDAPLAEPADGQRGPQPSAVRGPTLLERVSTEDAPTTALTAFGASALTSLTGFVSLVGLGFGPQTGMSALSVHARLSTALLLMSVGPSMGDLLNHNPLGFLVGAGGRTLLAGMLYGGVLLSAASRDPLLQLGAVMALFFGGLAWSAWGMTDLVRSLFAPDRWVERENQRRRPARSPERAAPRTYRL